LTPSASPIPCKHIENKQLQQTALHGSLNQFANSTDLLENPELCRKIKTLFE